MLQGSYQDFSVNWYNNLGAAFTLTLAIQMVSPHGSKIFGAILKWLKRKCDRGC